MAIKYSKILYQLKITIVFLGDSGVGKSCLITRFINGVFDIDRQAITEGSCANKTIGIPEIGKSLDLNIWDTEGTERYKSLTRIFCQCAKIVILVYDITRKESFDNLKNYWYNDIKEHCDSDVVIGIAGNKSDLYENEEVSEQEARDFAESIGAVFCLTSAQNNSGVNNLFIELGKKYLEPIHTTIESDIKTPEQKEESKQNSILGEKDVDKKKEEQKKKKKPCIIF